MQPINAENHLHVSRAVRDKEHPSLSSTDTKPFASHEAFHRSISSHLDANLDDLPMKYGRAISDPSHLVLEDDIFGVKDPRKRRFSLIPLNKSSSPSHTPTAAANPNWRPFPSSNASPVAGEINRRVHPIVATLQSMRKRSTENMVVTMVLSKKNENAAFKEPVSRVPLARIILVFSAAHSATLFPLSSRSSPCIYVCVCI